MGIIFVLIAGTLWGSMGIFVRGLAALGLSSLEICFVRVAVSTILMTLYFLIFNKSALKIKLKDLWCFIGTGLISLTFFGYCYFTTIQMTSMSVAAVLLYTSPVFVLILSAILFKEKITKKKIVCVIIAIIGCAFVSGVVGSNSGMTLPLRGILFGLGSGLGYGLYSIFGRYAIMKKYKALTITYYSFLFSAISLLFLVKPMDIVNKLGTGSVNINLLYVIGIAIVTTILPYTFYTLGLTKIENSKAAVVACIEPLMATAFGFLVFGEVLSIGEAAGVVLIIIAIILL